MTWLNYFTLLKLILYSDKDCSYCFIFLILARIYFIRAFYLIKIRPVFVITNRKSFIRIII
jgi:hypothetical protein